MPFAIALAISALLHAATIVMPGWALPGDGQTEPAALEAHLAVLPQPAPVTVSKPRPRLAPQKRVSVPVPPPVADSVVAVAESAPDAAIEVPEQPAALEAPAPTEAVAAEPLGEALAAADERPPAPPPVPPWPRSGRVRYVVTYGELGFVIGETIQEWHVEDGRYAIRSVAEPKGLAALRGVTRTQASAGEVTAAGLRPHEFRDQREGRVPEAAAFDWDAGRVAFSGGRGEGPLAADTQDLISVFYQLAWLAPRRDVALSVATANRVGRWTFEWVGEEELALTPGTLVTLHLRTRADGDTTEVWLAPAHGGLPVKIRHVDRKGDVFEQAADSLELN